MNKRIAQSCPGLAWLAALAAAGLLILAACGGKEEGGATPAASTPAPPVTIEVAEGDAGFAPTEITVSVGQKVTFNFTNAGQAVHNMRIAGPDGRYDTGDDAVTDPKVVNPGQKAKIDWQAPARPGKILFRCEYHPDRTGTITVE